MTALAHQHALPYNALYLRSEQAKSPRTMISTDEALSRLKAGNGHFVAGTTTANADSNDARRRELAGGQHPHAIVLGCSDSRVPPEIVFDQGLGDVFVIRVAGNVVTPTQIGSVEFAVEQFGTRLIVVLGHTNCGAVSTVLRLMDERQEAGTPHLRQIAECIQPTLEALVAEDAPQEKDALLRAAVRANIRTSVEHLQSQSPLIDEYIRDNRLRIVGGEYSLETGVVEFFDQ